MKITKVCIENYHIIRIVAANKLSEYQYRNKNHLYLVKNWLLFSLHFLIGGHDEKVPE